MMADGERLRRRALAEAEALRQPERIARIDADVLGVSPRRAEARDDVVGAVDAHAEPALAAALGTGVDRHGRHLVADLPVRARLRAHLDDGPRKLMTEDLSVRHHERARLGRVQIGAADAAVFDLDQEIAGAHGRLVDLLDRQGIADASEHRCFHLSPSSIRSRGARPPVHRSLS